ncbi:hypothetical protein BDW68DRAFT_185771 [Aspergillus falconensis]
MAATTERPLTTQYEPVVEPKTLRKFLTDGIYILGGQYAILMQFAHPGDGYFADDPELHKWTAAILFMAFIVVHETFIGKLSDATKRILFNESAIIATSLRMPPDKWPDTYEDFQEYRNHNVENLEVTDWARGLARFDRMRKKYGDILPDPKRHRVAFKITTAAGRWVHLMTPPFLRSLPHRYYKRNMRKAVKRINETGHWSKKRK